MLLRLRNVILLGLLIRIVVLVFLYVSNSNETIGFNSSNVSNDDVRYEQGAIIYSKTAKSFIDKEAFKNAYSQLGDYTGYAKEFSLWYWFVCIVTMIFKNSIVLRIFNILFSILTIKFLYDLVLLISKDNRVAIYTALFYSLNPYFVIFSCFLYKDQFLSLITVFLFLNVYRLFFDGWRKSFLIAILVSLAAFASLRSGFVILIFFSIIPILLEKYLYFFKKLNLYSILAFIFVPIISVYLLANSWDIIVLKYKSYVLSRTTNSKDIISFFAINGVSELYKYPFAFVFALLQPINLNIRLNCVADFVGYINVLGIPFAIGNFLIFMNRPLNKKIFFFVIHALFLITLITSLGINRHYYFLLPFFSYFFVEYCITAKKGIINVFIASVLLFFMLISVFILKLIII